MMEGDIVQAGAGAPQSYGTASVASGRTSANLGDILERILDKGLVIAGDIQVNLLDIELLTIKLRLVIASLDTAREVGINWWENDPWLSADASRRAEQRELGGAETDLRAENRQLRSRVSELEAEAYGGNSARRERRTR
jgi:Gas vesicle protein